MISKRSLLRLFLSVIVIGLGLLVLLLVYLLIQRNKTVILPKPTGQFAVARIGYDWIDDSRNEAYSETKGTKRKLSIWIWYPTDLNKNAKKTDYFPDKWETIQEKDSGFPYLQQNFRTINTNSFQDVPLSTRQTTYPLIVFEPGMGNIVFSYTTLAENLASQGYIVVGINPTYSSRFVVFSDESVAYRTPEGTIPENNLTDEQMNEVGSKLIKTWTEDMRFAVNKFVEMNSVQGSMWTGHMDTENIGTLGHSFGGAAAAESCLLDNRIKAGIDIDGYLYGVEKNPEKPFMFIMSQHQQNESYFQEFSKIQGVYNGLKKDGYLVEISKAAHASFLDNAIFFSPILKAVGVFGTIDGERGLRITNAYITAFFDKYLKNINSNFLKQKPSEYPEVKIQYK
ncbi:alpha/beta hydrolase family protein [Paenibacillus sp. GCM10027628]|uniref:alpha/beta hydrolase family protein n=1 Tax=Paenibacillus sp. GCM10027628 TaxID=3273413 RepID=UPI0036391D27